MTNTIYTVRRHQTRAGVVPTSHPVNLGHNVAMGNLSRQHTLGLFRQEMSPGSFIYKLLMVRNYLNIAFKLRKLNGGKF